MVESCCGETYELLADFVDEMGTLHSHFAFPREVLGIDEFKDLWCCKSESEFLILDVSNVCAYL